MTISPICTEPQSSPTMQVKVNHTKVRDPRWLQVEVCREYVRDNCPRGFDECRFAHPSPDCVVENGKVTACYDAMKARCQREKCKYFHPPKHIKVHLEAVGRTFQHQRMLQQQQQQQQQIIPPQLRPTPDFWGTLPSYTSSLLLYYEDIDLRLQSATYQWIPWFSGGEQFGAELISTRSPPLPRRVDKSDKLQVCTDYLENACTHLENDCPLAHPPPLIVPDHEGFVTVCMDFMKGTCQRHACRYFHPPPHLQAKVKAAQMRPGQIPVSLAAAGVPVYPSPMMSMQFLPAYVNPYMGPPGPPPPAPQSPVPVPVNTTPPLIPASPIEYTQQPFSPCSCVMPVAISTFAFGQQPGEPVLVNGLAVNPQLVNGFVFNGSPPGSPSLRIGGPIPSPGLNSPIS